MRIKTFTEKRPAELSVVQWRGLWEQGHEFARLWPKAIGFRVTGEDLYVYFEAALALAIIRGTFVKVRPGFPDNGPWEEDGLLNPEELKGYEWVSDVGEW